MTIDLKEIYKNLEQYRNWSELDIETSRNNYVFDILEKLGELVHLLKEMRGYTEEGILYSLKQFREEDKAHIREHLKSEKEKLEYQILDIFCDIAALTINAYSEDKHRVLEISSTDLISISNYYAYLLKCIYEFDLLSLYEDAPEKILKIIASICTYEYGFDFKVAMLQKAKQIAHYESVDYSKARNE